MFASCAFCRSSVIAGWPLIARERVSSCSRSTTSATCDRYTGAAALLRDDDAAELRRVLDPAFDAHDRVARAARQAAGRHVLVRRAIAVHHLVDADARAPQRGRDRCAPDLARDPAVDVDAATPGTLSRPLTITWSASDESSRELGRSRQHRERYDRLRVVAVGANDERSFTSRGKPGCDLRDLVAHVLHRAVHVGVEAELDDHLALALERARADRLDAGDAVSSPSSIGCVTSVSTASGDAPG